MIKYDRGHEMYVVTAVAVSKQWLILCQSIIYKP